MPPEDALEGEDVEGDSPEQHQVDADAPAQPQAAQTGNWGSGSRARGRVSSLSRRAARKGM